MNQANLEAALDSIQVNVDGIVRCRQAAFQYASEGKWDLAQAQLDLIDAYAGAIRFHIQPAKEAASQPPEQPQPCLLS